MIKYKLAIVAVIISVAAQAQFNPDSIQQQLMKYIQNYPQEKIYLHLDRPHYAPGDTIWFKAYITDAMNHLPDSVSKNIYVELIRKSDGARVAQQMIKNSDGISHGNISLKDSLAEGVYEIRSFTNWMRNFSDYQFFHREIYLRKKLEAKNSNTSNEQLLQVDDLQFFPEGGNLIAGLQNRVAFKGVNKMGRGVDLAAFIISEHNDTVATIQSKHLGMGSFIFTPKTGEKYHARIDKSSTGYSPLKKLFYLPQPIAQGYTFFVDNLSNKEAIKVISKNNFGAKDRPFIIGHCRGNVIFNVQSVNEGNSFSWTLQKTDIPDDGVLQLTLFNGQGIPQCERLIYNDTRTPLTITVTPDKQEYLPREKVTLSVTAKDYEGNPVQGNFSLSATDEQQVIWGKNNENIQSYFLLSSDVESLSKEVKGEIEQGGYYFDKSNVDASVHLDLLLMTQGWRRFLWNDVLGNAQINLSYGIENGISLHGKALLPNGKVSASPITVSLFSSNKEGVTQYLSTKTDAEGRFLFTNIIAGNETKVFLQGTRDKGSKEVKFVIDQTELPSYKPQPNLVSPFYFDQQEIRMSVEQRKRLIELENEIAQGKNKLLKEVVITGRQEKKDDPRKVFYSGMNVYTVRVDDSNCRTAPSIFFMLQGRVPGLQVSNNGVTIRGPRSINGAGSKVAFLVDGVFTDQTYLDAIPPCSVESIDVVTMGVAMLNAHGVVSILTKAGSSAKKDWAASVPNAPNTKVVEITGYTLAKEFYSPKYEVSDTAKVNMKKPDFRSTLYWNPEIKTDAEGNAKVTFWNSGEKTSVHVIIEGLSSDGTPGVSSVNYKVE